MIQSDVSMAQRIAQVARKFEEDRTGHPPRSAVVVLTEDILVIALRGALSAAEVALMQHADGAAQVQEFHRQLFASASEPLRKDIERITGVKVVEATADIEPGRRMMANVFTTGTIVQVVLLADKVATDVWSDEPST